MSSPTRSATRPLRAPAIRAAAGDDGAVYGVAVVAVAGNQSADDPVLGQVEMTGEVGDGGLMDAVGCEFFPVVGEDAPQFLEASRDVYGPLWIRQFPLRAGAMCAKKTFDRRRRASRGAMPSSGTNSNSARGAEGGCGRSTAAWVLAAAVAMPCPFPRLARGPATSCLP